MAGIFFLITMAVHLHVPGDLLNNSEEKEAKVHMMPCLIKANDEANVSKYFEPNITESSSRILTTSFRGYPLLGKEINVPENYTGIILRETHEKMNKETSRNLYATETFKKFTYWNWDKVPTKNDKLMAALDWLDISHALHKPIEEG